MTAWTITEPRIVDGMPFDVYAADPCPTPALSNSIIKPLLQQSPFHAGLQHPKLNPDCVPDDNAAKFDLGTAAHALLLEGADRCRIIEADDFRTKAAREERDLAYADGKTPLLRAQYDAAKVMVDRAREFIEHTEFAGVFKRGKPEQSFFWQEECGIWVKARADFLTDERDLILDFKTTGLPPRKWTRAMPDHGYDTQSLLYQRGMSALGHNTRFVFLVQETCEPYACWLVQASESMRELAGMKIARAVRLWSDCLRNQRFPSYPLTVQHAEAPGYALIEEEALQ
jgi:hypothetical protein